MGGTCGTQESNKRCLQNFEEPEIIDHFEDVFVDGSIILNWILEKECGKLQTKFVWLKTGTSEGSCERGDYQSCTLKWGIA
jgi:hypothetical protein